MTARISFPARQSISFNLPEFEKHEHEDLVLRLSSIELTEASPRSAAIAAHDRADDALTLLCEQPSSPQRDWTELVCLSRLVHSGSGRNIRPFLQRALRLPYVSPDFSALYARLERAVVHAEGGVLDAFRSVADAVSVAELVDDQGWGSDQLFEDATSLVRANIQCFAEFQGDVLDEIASFRGSDNMVELWGAALLQEGI